jgi:hypothetical protein
MSCTMVYTSSPGSIAEDWLRCKEAHTGAKDLLSLCQHFDPDAAAPFFQHLAEMAGAFKAMHGIEFGRRSRLPKGGRVMFTKSEVETVAIKEYTR